MIICNALKLQADYMIICNALKLQADYMIICNAELLGSADNAVPQIVLPTNFSLRIFRPNVCSAFISSLMPLVSMLHNF
jgi:hypothetical protein